MEKPRAVSSQEDAPLSEADDFKAAADRRIADRDAKAAGGKPEPKAPEKRVETKKIEAAAPDKATVATDAQASGDGGAKKPVEPAQPLDVEWLP